MNLSKLIQIKIKLVKKLKESEDMRIEFNYKDVKAEDVKTVLEFFYEKYKNLTGTDELPVQFGKINLYIALSNKSDNHNLALLDDEGDRKSWEVKSRELRGTKKIKVKEFLNQDTENEKIIIYEVKERENKKWYY